MYKIYIQYIKLQKFIYLNYISNESFSRIKRKIND